MIRTQTAWTLGEIGDKRAVPMLTGLLSDENEDVQRIACEALEKIGTPEALAAAAHWRKTH